MKTSTDIMRQIDHLVSYGARIAVAHANGTDPTVWSQKADYERDCLQRQLDRIIRE